MSPKCNQCGAAINQPLTDPIPGAPWLCLECSGATLDDFGLSEADTFSPDDAIGMSQQEAAEWFKGFGYTMRVTRKNGSAAIITRDYKTDRVNVAIQDGKVTEICGVG